MQVSRPSPTFDNALVGFGVSVLLLSEAATSAAVAHRLGALGVRVDVISELFTALSAVIEDPSGYALLVIDCDSAGIGGLEGGRRAIHRLGEAACFVTEAR